MFGLRGNGVCEIVDHCARGGGGVFEVEFGSCCGVRGGLFG